MTIFERVSKACNLSTTYWKNIKIVMAQHPDCLGPFDVARCFVPWLSSLTSDSTPLEDEQPWITFPAQYFLQRILRPNFRVFEFGAGGSTLFFAKRVKELVTVEHEPEWLKRTAAKVRFRQDFKWQSLLEPPTKNSSKACFAVGDPDSYASTDANYVDMSFEKYATSIKRYDPDYFDLVSIDGRARPSCFKHSLSRVRKGGYILVDNAEREEYGYVERIAKQFGLEVLDFWGPGPYNEYFWRTILIRKTVDVLQESLSAGFDPKLRSPQRLPT
jgi:hypothetical protein